MHISSMKLTGIIICLFASVLSHGQTDMEKWLLRNEVVNEITGKEFNEVFLEGVSEISDPQDLFNGTAGVARVKIKLTIGREFAFSLAITSSGYDLDSLRQLEETDANKVVIALLNNWIEKCRNDFGADHVVYDLETLLDTDNPYSITIGNIPTLAFYFRDPERNDGRYDVIIDPRSIPDIMMTEERRSFANRSFNEKLSEFDDLKDGATYYPVERFSERYKKEGKLLSTKNLRKAVEYYMQSLDAGNPTLELEWTYPVLARQYLNYNQYSFDLERNEYSSRVVTGPLGIVFSPSEVSEVSDIVEYKGLRYAQVYFRGTSIGDFTKIMEALKEMGREEQERFILDRISAYASINGEENVSYDSIDHKIITVNREVKVFAIQDPELEGWKFSPGAVVNLARFRSPGVSSYSLPVNITTAFVESSQDMDSTEQFQIIPSPVLRGWADDNLSIYEDAILQAGRQYLESKEGVGIGRAEISKLLDVIIYKDRIYGLLFLTDPVGRILVNDDGKPSVLLAEGDTNGNEWNFTIDQDVIAKNLLISRYKRLF
jgi:hypothetical protein